MITQVAMCAPGELVSYCVNTIHCSRVAASRKGRRTILGFFENSYNAGLYDRRRNRNIRMAVDGWNMEYLID